MPKGKAKAAPNHLSKPSSGLQDLNFKVTPEVHLAFKATAAMRNMSMKDLLEAAFRLWLDTHGDDLTRKLLPPKVDKSDKRS